MNKTGNDAIGTFDVKAKRAVLCGDGNGKVAFTAMAEYLPLLFKFRAELKSISVGKLVVAALQHPEASEDKILIVNSFTATPNEILAEFEKQTGAKWDVSYVSLGELRETERKWWEEGNPWATAVTLKRIWTEGGTLYESGRGRDNGLIGDPEMETLGEQVGQVIERQLKA